MAISNIDRWILQGPINIPYVPVCSKSYAHRAILLSYLTGRRTILRNFTLCDDTEVTLQALYSSYERKGDALVLDPKHRILEGRHRRIWVGESGSTLRFLIPILAQKEGITFSGTPTLLQRPLQYYEELFQKEGLLWEKREDHLLIGGPLRQSMYHVPGRLTSQYISAMLMASIPRGDWEGFSLTFSPDASRQYIAITLDVMKAFGVEYGNQKTHVKEMKQTMEYVLPEDASNRAFYEALAKMGGVKEPLPEGEYGEQKDGIFRQWIEEEKDQYNLRDTIDLAPVMACYFASIGKRVRLTGIENLIYKESNRLEEIGRVLRAFGRGVSIYEDSLVVTGGRIARPKPIQLHLTDHRMVHGSLLLAQNHGKPVILTGVSSLKKSHRELYDILQRRNHGISIR
ncbi:MAG: hypothetical protein Q4Q17_01030 [Tissierellia bacterium]|nr:hypothetical protein [Tissierellia bacterium]